LARTLILAALAMANSLASAQLRNFDGHAIVDMGTEYTIVGGRFTPTVGIDLPDQVVVLCVSGAWRVRVLVTTGSFRKNGLGGYIASVNRSLFKADILLQPFSRGDWALVACIEDFVPGSPPVTVSLTIGSQTGTTDVKVYSF
jgi:hypothetical protein